MDDMSNQIMEHTRLARKAVLCMVPRKEDRADAYQDALVGIWRGLVTYDASKGAVVGTWLWYNIKHQVSNGLRRKYQLRRKHTIQMKSMNLSDRRLELEDPRETPPQQRTRSLIQDALEGLTGEETRMLVGHVLERCHFYEMEDEFGVTFSAIAGRYRRLIARLKEERLALDAAQ